MTKHATHKGGRALEGEKQRRTQGKAEFNLPWGKTQNQKQKIVVPWLCCGRFEKPHHRQVEERAQPQALGQAADAAGAAGHEQRRLDEEAEGEEPVRRAHDGEHQP